MREFLGQRPVPPRYMVGADQDCLWHHRMGNLPRKLSQPGRLRLTDSQAIIIISHIVGNSGSPPSRAAISFRLLSLKHFSFARGIRCDRAIPRAEENCQDLAGTVK